MGIKAFFQKAFGDMKESAKEQEARDARVAEAHARTEAAKARTEAAKKK